jgi:hypothetical protein
MPIAMKALAMACVAPMLVSASLPGTMNDGMPPLRFQGNTAAVVIFTDRTGIDSACGVAPPGYQIIACTRRTADGTPVVTMPNPAPYGDTEFYARIMAHELGHVSGWSGMHEQ